MWLSLVSAFAWADGTDIAPPADTTIKHFTQIDKFVFGGSKPTTDTDFEFLRSLGVKYILQAHFLPFSTGTERKKAAEYGLQYVSVEMNASPIPPMEARQPSVANHEESATDLHPLCLRARQDQPSGRTLPAVF
jgi:hypothetical protein